MPMFANARVTFGFSGLRAALTCLVASAIPAAMSLHAFAAETPAAPPKIALRVIYFGHPQTPRAKDFGGFLEQHFTKVAQGDLDTFSEADPAGYDVTILDYGELKIVKNHIESPKRAVSRQYSHPTITIGATGGLVCQQLGLKTGYL